MVGLKFILSVLALVVSAWAAEKITQELSVSEALWQANKDVVHGEDEPYIVDDIAYKSESERNADPCTSQGCMWPKSSDGMVYIPYSIAKYYTSRELAVIEHGLKSFNYISCIRFIRHTNEQHYLYIQSLNGCWSWVGRTGNEQSLSLSSNGCIYHHTIQHELLHALGFNHEQTRSDRDSYIRVLWQNIISGMEYNFDIINTLNQGTPYDYNSVMQYHRYGFSKNNEPTMEPIPDPSVDFGMATEMSQNDIIRLNKLYQC